MRVISIVLLSGFVLIMNMQNGIHLLVYEVAKPIIIEKYCINQDEPELQCDGMCHLKDIMLDEEEKESGSNDASNIPPPEVNFQTISYFLSDINAFSIWTGDYTSFDQNMTQFQVIWRTPIQFLAMNATLQIQIVMVTVMVLLLQVLLKMTMSNLDRGSICILPRW